LAYTRWPLKPAARTTQNECALRRRPLCRFGGRRLSGGGLGSGRRRRSISMAMAAGEAAVAERQQHQAALTV
jgi:hypothetical protein